MYNERDFYYEYYCKQFRNDMEALEELKYLYDNYKEFDFTNYSKGYYKKDYMEKYGYDLTVLAGKLYRNDTLEYGLKSDTNFKKVMFFLNNEDLYNISEELILDDNISIKDLLFIKVLLENPDMKGIFRSTIRDVDGLKLALSNKEYLNNMEFLANQFDIYFLPEDFFETICNKEFTNFVKNIDKTYLNARTHISDLLKLFKSNKKYFQKELTDEEKNIVNNYVFNTDDMMFPLDMNNLNDFYKNREALLNRCICFMQPIQLKEYISKVYFNRKYSKLVEILEDTKVLFEKENIKLEKFDSLYKLINLETKEDFFKYAEEIKYDTNLGEKIVKLAKETSKKSMSNKVNSFVCLKGREVIKLSGEEFYMLVHKIKGFGNQKLAGELYNDPSIWTKNYDPYSYISTSAISDKHLGICDGNGYVLGFKNIKPEYILAMGPLDILTDTKMVKNDIDNLKTRYMEPEDLIDKTKELYNEVVLKRYIGKEALMPDFVLTVDGVNNKDREVSNYFGIPIYDVNSKCYADKMINAFETAIAKQEFKKACKLLMILGKGFNTCNYVRNSYLNLSKLESMINNIVHQYLHSETISTEKSLELLELVKAFDNVASIISFLNNSYFQMNTDDAKNAVLNKLKK